MRDGKEGWDGVGWMERERERDGSLSSALSQTHQPKKHTPQKHLQGWTPLQYAIAKGKYGPTEEAGVYPEDVLRFYGATKAGEGVYGPPLRATPRSPRDSFNPRADGFCRERGTYQEPVAHP
jgi:hypothetical protein